MSPITNLSPFPSALPSTLSESANQFLYWPVRDVNSRNIFKDPQLCSQFLRDNVDISLLKNVQPEDIEDVTQKYQTYLGTSLETDTVKKINTHNPNHPELYMISLIEHKSRVDYNVSMQLLHYMSCIWKEYANEQEKLCPNISRNKGFLYPPIFPIVYYEGSAGWTSDLHLKDRIFQNDIFEKYIPDFSYHLIRIHDYSNETLLSRENEMALIMLINKVQTPEDFAAFLKTSSEKISQIIEQAPPHLLEIIISTIWSLCMKMNVPQDEALKYVDSIKENKMGYLFENMEKMDIQEERRKTQEAQAQLAQEKHSKIMSIIKLCREFNLSSEETILKLMENCSLTSEEASDMLHRYPE